MKNILFATFFCFIIISAFSQETIGKYSCSEKQKNVKYSEDSEQYFIEISSGSGRDAYFIIKNQDVPAFRKALSAAKVKYKEWVKVAKENNVTDLKKDIDIFFPTGSFAWLGSEWHFNFSAKPEAIFLITKGDYILVLFGGQKYTASDNRYIDEKAFWFFSSVKEIEELELLLTPEYLANYKSKKSNKEDLFK